jgi:hypothetical protein
MREKIYSILNKIYGVTMMIAFFAGLLPALPLIGAVIIGGSTGEAICLFIYKQYYPWVIALAAASVLVGLIAMYVGKKTGSKK